MFRGCESETDTEEFEKVGQSPLELQFESKSTNLSRPGTHDVSTLTEVGLYNVPPKKPPRMFLKTSIDSQTNKLLNYFNPENSGNPENPGNPANFANPENPETKNYLNNSAHNPFIDGTAVLQISTCVQHNCQQPETNTKSEIIEMIGANTTVVDYFSQKDYHKQHKNESIFFARNSCSTGEDSGYSNSSMKKSMSLVSSEQNFPLMTPQLKKSLSLTSPYKVSCKMPNSYTKVMPADVKFIPGDTKLIPQDSLSLCSPCSSQGHQNLEFVTDEFYIDESMPSSLSIEGTSSQGEISRQLEQANNVIALFQVYVPKSCSFYVFFFFLFSVYFCTNA